MFKSTLAKQTNAMTIQDAQAFLVLPKAGVCFCMLHSLAVHPSMRSRDAEKVEVNLREHLNLGMVERTQRMKERIR